MRQSLCRLIVLSGIMACATLSSAVEPFISSSSTVSGYFAWGNSGWWSPNVELPYAETEVFLNFTENLYRPTYLNIVGQYSQNGQSCSLQVYIDTADMCGWDPSDPHSHACWWNSGTRAGGHYVGTFTVTDTIAMYHFDVDAWLESHPSPGSWNRYYVALYYHDVGSDAVVWQLWLGKMDMIGLGESATQEPAHARESALYPNPSSGKATLTYFLDEEDRVTIRIYDVSGRLVRVLAKDEYRTAGDHFEVWDGADAGRQAVPNGTYFYELQVGGKTTTKKSVMIH